MAKLSHIDDFAQEQPARTAEQQAPQAARPDEAEAKLQEVEDRIDTAIADADARLAEDIDMSAQQELDFHGLDSAQPMGIGHKFLIIAAVIVVAAAILYIVNSWIHFI